MDNPQLIIDTPAILELTGKKVKFQLFTHQGDIFSLEQAARERGQRPEQVIRSILFRIGNNEFVMVLAAGPSQISWPRLTRTPRRLANYYGYKRGSLQHDRLSERRCHTFWASFTDSYPGG